MLLCWWCAVADAEVILYVVAWRWDVTAGMMV